MTELLRTATDLAGDRPAATADTDLDALDALLAEIAPGRATGRAAERFRAFARELSHRPDMWRRLLAEHVASPDGRYCAHRQCRRSGCGSLATPHPCSTRVVALTASAIHGARAGPAAAARP